MEESIRDYGIQRVVFEKIQSERYGGKELEAKNSVIYRPWRKHSLNSLIKRIQDYQIKPGHAKSIKKDEILSLQGAVLMKTGLERSGQKVYILNNAENTTGSAQASV